MATVTKKKGKFRVTEGPHNAVVKNACGKPLDGGGHMTGTAAEKQARAVNRSRT